MTSEQAAEEEEHLWTSAWLDYLGKQRQNRMIKNRKKAEGQRTEGQGWNSKLLYTNTEISIRLLAHFLSVKAFSSFVPHAQSNVSSSWTTWMEPFQCWWLLTDGANLIILRMCSTYRPQNTEFWRQKHFGKSRKTKWNLRAVDNLPRKEPIKCWYSSRNFNFGVCQSFALCWTEFCSRRRQILSN